MSETLRINFNSNIFNYYYRTKKELEKKISGVKIEFEEAEDVTMNCYLDDGKTLKKLWRTLASEIKNDEVMQKGVTVTCTDGGSWVNYLLLHHPNSRKKTDKL